MAQYYVLDTLAERDACEAACYAAWIVGHQEYPYALQTTAWSTEQTRETDGKYIIPVCECYDNAAGYTIEESAADWFPASEL